MASLPPHHVLLAQEAAGKLSGAVGADGKAAAGGKAALLPPSVSAGPSASEGAGEIRTRGEGGEGGVQAGGGGGGGGGGHMGVTIDQWEEEEEGAGGRELLWVQLVGFPCVELSEMKEQFVASVREIHG